MVTEYSRSYEDSLRYFFKYGLPFFIDVASYAAIKQQLISAVSDITMIANNATVASWKVTPKKVNQ